MAPKSAWRPCTPGCPTHTAKARRRCPPCCRERCSILRWSASFATSLSLMPPESRLLARGTLLALGAFLPVRRRAVHRPPDRRQAADGLLQRRAHGRHRPWLRLWRTSRNCRRALPHAESFAEQVADVFRRRQRHAGLRGQSAFRRFAWSANVFRYWAALWLAGAVAITGAPPFGLFLSELTIIRAGLARITLAPRRSDRGPADRHFRRLS